MLLATMNSVIHVHKQSYIISSPEPSGSQGELIVNPWSVVRPSSSTMLKHLLLGNRLADQSQILCGASLGRRERSLYKWSRSHDQNLTPGGCLHLPRGYIHVYNHYFQTSSSLKPHGQSMPNFMWSLLGYWERKFI